MWGALQGRLKDPTAVICGGDVVGQTHVGDRWIWFSTRSGVFAPVPAADDGQVVCHEILMCPSVGSTALARARVSGNVLGTHTRQRSGFVMARAWMCIYGGSAVAMAHTMTTTYLSSDGPTLGAAISVAMSLDLLSGSAYTVAW